MSPIEPNLSRRSVAVLEMIAAGSSYEQILSAMPDITYLDIFHAAEEALNALATRTTPPPPRTLDEIRIKYPRAYEKWTPPEEQYLRAMIVQKLSVAQMANKLKRQRSAIRSRILKLNLIDLLPADERAEVIRISKLDPSIPDPSDPPETFG
jgi:hypothetical protein